MFFCVGAQQVAASLNSWWGQQFLSFPWHSLDRPQGGHVLSTEVTKEDRANVWTDEYGAKYSKDRKRLVKGSRNLENYEIRKGIKVICDAAFHGCSSLQRIMIPNGVTSIGEGAFDSCSSLRRIVIPDGVTSIGDEAFCFCPSLQHIYVCSASYERFKKMLPRELHSKLTIKD